MKVFLWIVLLVMLIGGILEWAEGGYVAVITVIVVCLLYIFKTYIVPGK